MSDNEVSIFHDLEDAYKAASEIYDQWTKHTQDMGVWAAWLEFGTPLRAARDTFIKTAGDDNMSVQGRFASLVNAASCFSVVGRKFEAIDLYNEAAELLPEDGAARGNRGLIMADLSLYLEDHNYLVHQAIEDLSYAASNPLIQESERIDFIRGLEVIKRHQNDTVPPPFSLEYKDEYSSWAWRNDLLLSTAIGSKPPEDRLDTVNLRNLVTSLDDLEGAAVPPLVLVMNAIKRDYLSTRLLTYLSTEAPEEVKLRQRSGSARYIDTLGFELWNLEGGLITLAYASAINLADKIATFLAMWLNLPYAQINDQNWLLDPKLFAKSKKNPNANFSTIHPKLDSLLSSHPRPPQALIGLMDLAQEESSSPSRPDRRRVRDAAVHRFLAIRSSGAQTRSKITEYVSHRELVQDLMASLQKVRRMYLQVVLAVSQDGLVKSGPEIMPMTLYPYQDEP